MRAETLPYFSVATERISTPQYGSVVLLGLGVRLMVRIPFATAAFCGVN